MKIFVSYCEKDNEGLKYAKRAKNLCKEKKIDSWVWSIDSNTAEWLQTDIVKNIDSSDAMLTIVTKGTTESDAQKQEWSYAGSLNRLNCSIRREGLTIPLELRAKNSPEFGEGSFDEVCNKVIDDILVANKFKSSLEPVREPHPIVQVQHIVERLERRSNELNKLNEEVVKKFYESVWDGYLANTVVRNLTSIAEASQEDYKDMINIAIRSSFDLDRFNSKDHIWGPAFKQLGANIAAGEERLLVETVLHDTRIASKVCDENELSIVLGEIKRLNKLGHLPEVILVPPRMFRSFVSFFNGKNGKIDLSPPERGREATLEVEDNIRLGVFILGGNVLGQNIMIWNKSNVLWKIIPNPTTGHVLTVGIGIGLFPDKAEFIVATTVKCHIKNRQGIAMIQIADEENA